MDAAGNTTAAIGKGFAIGSAALVSLSLYGAFITRSSKFTNNYPIMVLLTHIILIFISIRNSYSFLSKNQVDGVNVNSPLIFSGLLIGAMLPYAFSALTMKSVG